MQQDTPKDTPAWTARFSTVEFDCELPPEAKSELLRPRRPRILGQPPCPPQKPPQVDSVRSRGHPALGWLLALIVLVLLGAVIYLSWPSPANRAAALQESAARSREVEQQADRALQALRTPAAQTPVVQPTPASTPSAVVPTPAPRASSVRVSAPKAQLVRLPNFTAIAPENIDQTHVITMPYGTEVSATLRGFLEQESQLPRVGHIGDMYVVGTVPWIFIQAPGTTAPTWIDP